MGRGMGEHPQPGRRDLFPTGSVQAKVLAGLDAGTTVILNWLSYLEPVYGIAGPIFEKELRVSGRRRRTFILRFIYLAVLGGLVGMVWLSMLTIPSLSGSRAGGAAYAYMMAEAGIILTGLIVWFQFIVLQVAAVVMLSTSISDEVYRRTLGVLLTTPITSPQIVLGKFLGKMLQIVLLLVISVPLLVVIRVLGGVTLDYVVSSSCVTLTTALLGGALSMFFSVGSRAVPLIILKTVVAWLILFVLGPLVFAALAPSIGSTAANWLALHANPYLTMVAVSAKASSPMAAGATVAFQWWVHCLGMVAATALILAACMVRVRRAALRQLGGDVGRWRALVRGRPDDGHIRRVRGSPVVWKESHSRIFHGRVRGMLGTGILLAVLGVTYWLFWDDLSSGGMSSSIGHITYGIILMSLGTLSTAVVTATAVTAEKESGTWPLLLATPLSDPDIVLGKAVGVVRRSLPAWIPLGVHCVLFAALGTLHWIVPVLTALVVLGIVVLLAGSGLVFGVLLKRTATAAVANVIFCLMLWVGLPIMFSFGIGIVAMLMTTAFPPLFAIFLVHPAVEMVVLVEGAGGSNAARPLLDLEFSGPFPGRFSVIWLTAAFILSAAVYIAVGWVMLRATIVRLRRSAF